MTDTEPPIRLLLAALFMAARIVATTREQLVSASLADADELLRQVPL